MDKLDCALLALLIENSRQPTTALAKKLKVSREVVNYRINKLIKEGIILNFITEIDFEKMGFVSAAVFVNIKATTQKEFGEYLNKSPYVSWVAEQAGLWSFGFSIFGKTNLELNEKFNQMYSLFKGAIIDHRFVLHKVNTFFYEKFFGVFNVTEKAKKYTTETIDAYDKSILKCLSKNSRISYFELSGLVNLGQATVCDRVKKLERAGYITRYSVFVDVSKLNIYQYSIFVINKNTDVKQKLIDYLALQKNISFIAEYIGDQFIEFGIFVDNPYKLKPILNEIEERFPDNRVMEISLFQKDLVSVGLPDCVFQ